MTDIMIDLETTGVRSGHSGILQIAAVKFNLETGDVDPVVFDRCPSLLPNRFWDDGTRDFWNKFPNVLNSIVSRQEDYPEVYSDLALFVSGHRQPLRFWSKPMSFDWGLLASHYDQLGMQMPFAYRTARDVNTYIAACDGRRADHLELKYIEDNHTGPLHNALSDCVLQIKKVFAAKRGEFYEVVEGEIIVPEEE